jgi:hypothetical protein
MRQIADVTRSRYMPPWKVDPSNGPFIGQRPLSEHEIDVIQRWTAAGAPGTSAPGTPAPSTQAPGTQAPGTSTQHPAPSTQHPAPGNWQLGPPDLVITLPEPFTLQGEGTDVFRIFVLPIPVAVERYVRGLEFQPGNPKVVHHANIRIDRTSASRALDEADPAAGYSGLILRSAEYPDGHFLVGRRAGSHRCCRRIFPGASHRNPTSSSEVQQAGGESVSPSIGVARRSAADADTGNAPQLGRRDVIFPPARPVTSSPTTSRCRSMSKVQALQPHAHYRLREARGRPVCPTGRRTLYRFATGISANSVYVTSRHWRCRKVPGCRWSTFTTTPLATREILNGRRCVHDGDSGRQTKWAICGFRRSPRRPVI